MLEEYGEEVEFDLQRYHQVALTGLWTGDLSWRRLGVLVTHLPPESALKTALRNAMPEDDLKQTAAVVDYGPWSQTDMLLAELIDVGRWLQWSKTKAATANRDAPKPFPRPGVNRKPRAEPASNAKVVDLLEFVRRNNGASPEGYVAHVQT